MESCFSLAMLSQPNASKWQTPPPDAGPIIMEDMDIFYYRQLAASLQVGYDSAAPGGVLYN